MQTPKIKNILQIGSKETTPTTCCIPLVDGNHVITVNFSAYFHKASEMIG
jgi:hypothetical protein